MDFVAESLTCNVVAAPLGDLSERLRTVADAFGFSTDYGCRFFVDWRPDAKLSLPWNVLFAPSIEPPPPGLAAGVEAASRVNPFAVAAVVFRRPSPEAVFDAEAHAVLVRNFYSELLPRPGLLRALAL